MGTVGNLQPFADSPEQDRVFSNNVSGSDHLHPDLFFCPLTHHPLSAIDSYLTEISSHSLGN
jgi:hypothetical protein